MHSEKLGQQLKCWIKSNCILFPEEALPTSLKSLINVAAVGCVLSSATGSSNIMKTLSTLMSCTRSGDDFKIPIVMGYKQSALQKGWLKIRLFSDQTPVCVFFDEPLHVGSLSSWILLIECWQHSALAAGVSHTGGIGLPLPDIIFQPWLQIIIHSNPLPGVNQVPQSVLKSNYRCQGCIHAFLQMKALPTGGLVNYT